jgi:uncharacterized phage infection (PIP) family protein YhgE
MSGFSQRTSKPEVTGEGNDKIETAVERRDETRKMLEDFRTAGEVASAQSAPSLQETADTLNRLNASLASTGTQEVDQRAGEVDATCEEMAAHENELEQMAETDKDAAEGIAAGRREVESAALDALLAEQQQARDDAAEFLDGEAGRIRDSREESERDAQAMRDGAGSIADSLKDF